METGYLLAPLIALGAYFVRGVAGFGSALVASPLLAQFFPLTLVVPLVVVLDNSGSIAQAWRHRRQIAWRDLLPLLPFSFLGIVVALQLHDMLASRALKFVLGLFVIAFALYQLTPLPATTLSRRWAAPAGFMGGLVGGLFGTGGPFYVIYYRLRQLPKTAFLASIAMLFVIDGALRIAGFALGGYYTAQHAWLLALMAPAAWLGLRLGHRLHLDLTQAQFTRVLSGLLIASGSLLVWRSL
ncbi:MAG: sulfite exporter TauE/SafE family protein [Thiobacillaceae bacterium]